MKRTFIAVKFIPGKKLLEAVSDLKAGLPPRSVKWIEPDIMHITLAFLGDTDEDLVVNTEHELELTCAGSGKVEFDVSELGVFPSLHRPKVIWAGIKNADSLIILQSKIKAMLENLNVHLEERAFIPHLTLGRVKILTRTDNLGKILDKYKNVEFQRVEINELIYFESILQPSGPIYKPILKILL